MRLIFLGSDRKVFNQDSQVFARVLNYAKEATEIHLIVFTLKKDHYNFFEKGNLKIYPTNSLSKILYIKDAEKIGLQILNNQKTSNDFIVSAQDPFEAGLVAIWLKQKTGTKVQVQIHTDFLSQFFNQGILNKIRLKIARKVLPEADQIRVVSERIKQSLIKSNFKIKTDPKILPVFNFNNELDEEIDLPRDVVIKIGCLARLEKEKNLILALTVFQRLVAQNVSASFYVAGRGSQLKKLKKLADKLGISNRVFWLGEIANSKNFLKKMDIYFQTSNYEGFGMSLFEAMSSGLPIVTSDVGLVGDLLKNQHGGFVCSVSDQDCFLSGLLKLIQDENLRKIYGKNNQKVIFESDLPKNQNEYLDKYFDLLKQIQ